MRYGLDMPSVQADLHRRSETGRRCLGRSLVLRRLRPLLGQSLRYWTQHEFRRVTTDEKNQKSIALLLAILMVSSLAACSSPTSSSDSSSNTDVSDSAGDGSSSEGADSQDSWEGMEFDVTIAVTDSSKDETWWNTDIYNAAVAWSEETGVKLNLLNGGGTDVRWRHRRPERDMT